MKVFIYTFICLFIESCNLIPVPEYEETDLPYDEAEKLVQDFHNYNKIKSMDDCSRCLKFINGVQLRMKKEEAGNENCDGQYYEDVLSQMSIDKEIFDDFRKRLKETKLRDYERDSCFDLFVVDGFVNDSWGFIRISCDSVPTVPFRIGNNEIQFLERVKEKWYRFGGH